MRPKRARNEIDVAKKPKVVIDLTPEQLMQLEPLFEACNKRPMKGAVLGQAWRFGLDGKAAFSWVTPKEMIKIIEKAVAKAKDA